MQHQIPDIFQQLDIEIVNRHSVFNDYLQENLPLVYINTGSPPANSSNIKECPLPYDCVKDYLQSSTDWMWYLLNNPSEYKRCDFSTWDETELTFLLREKPALGCCIQWKELLSAGKRQILLAYHPQWADNFTELDALPALLWVKLLTLHPEYDFLAPWQKFSGENWQKLLSEHPEFAQYCNFTLLQVGDWEKLLLNQIRFFPFCPKDIRKEFSPETLYELFAGYPEIKNLWEE